MSSSDQPPQIAGVVGFFNDPSSLIEATKKVREANYESFDVYSPYPIHGMDQIQGVKRSRLPFISMSAGITGLLCAIALQGWTSVISWPLNVGGKPLWSWPAFVPIFFELTVLFSGLATVGGMFALNRLPKKRRAFDPSITRDRFAIMIDSPRPKKRADASSRFKAFSESEAQSFLKGVGALEVRSVEEQGWF